MGVARPEAGKSGAAEVLLLGDPRLRRPSSSVDDPLDREFRAEVGTLIATLEAFRARQGFGRAIAAPQIGVSKRFIVLNLGEGPFVIVNPEIVWRDTATFTLWDDCMSFPFLLVKLRRHQSISVHYTDVDGRACRWDELEPALAELLQHEIDHLDGVLAIDRAIDREAIVSRAAYESNRSWFDSQVDYVIASTIA